VGATLLDGNVRTEEPDERRVISERTLSETDSYVPFLACLVSIFLKRKSSNENGRNTLISKELVG
jgi:hypothetical protein